MRTGEGYINPHLPPSETFSSLQPPNFSTYVLSTLPVSERLHTYILLYQSIHSYIPSYIHTCTFVTVYTSTYIQLSLIVQSCPSIYMATPQTISLSQETACHVWARCPSLVSEADALKVRVMSAVKIHADNDQQTLMPAEYRPSSTELDQPVSVAELHRSFVNTNGNGSTSAEASEVRRCVQNSAWY